MCCLNVDQMLPNYFTMRKGQKLAEIFHVEIWSSRRKSFLTQKIRFFALKTNDFRRDDQIST